MRKAFHAIGSAFREAGQQLDRVGLTVAEREGAFLEPYSRHRPIMNIFDKRPSLLLGVFVAPSASLIGDVTIRSKASVWYGSVVRGDTNRVLIGFETNIQDRAVITASDSEVIIGSKVTVGHGAIISSSVIGNGVLIGQGSIIQSGSIIQDGAVVAAGAVVLPGTFIKKNELWAGNPATFIRATTDHDEELVTKTVEAYVNLAETHSAEYPSGGTVHLNS